MQNSRHTLDTSVVVDLERGDLFFALFQLPYEFQVPDLLYVKELEPYGKAFLVDLGLKVETLSSAEIDAVQEVLRTDKAISTEDAAVLVLARRHPSVLLVGDQALRQAAEGENTVCHGVLWVLDQIEAAGIIDGPALHTALTRIVGARRCRLPRAEVSARLERFGPSGT